MRVASAVSAGIVPVLVLSLVLAGCGTNVKSPVGCISCGGDGLGPIVLYATTSVGQTVSFGVSTSTGALTAPVVNAGPTASPGITVGTPSPNAVPPIEFLYVSDPQHNALDAFAISISSSTLTPLAGSPFALGGVPAGLTAVGAFVYATDSRGTIDGFVVGVDGALSPVFGSPFPAGLGPMHATAAPSFLSIFANYFLYATDFSDPDGGVSGYTVNTSTGVLTPIAGSPFPTLPDSGPSGIVFDGFFVYVALSKANSIAVFSADQISGVLTPVAGSPFPTGNNPSSLVVTLGPVLYVLNRDDHTISGYNVNLSSGFLTSSNGSPFAAGTATGEITLAGNFLYAADTTANAILAFAVDPILGSLTPVPGSPFPANASPLALHIVNTAIP